MVRRLGRREYAVAEAGTFRRADRDPYPARPCLGFHLVTYVRLMEVARLRPGDAVFVSGWPTGATGGPAGRSPG
ncbi:hypothetical protein AB0L59_32130 [Streptomyces sp. NPDC052109]|uniref:hypothetical protein n=1 Tax=Streptomyces sp. NPDC052109 TaxID=3155527 RepID=UPI00343EB29E